MHPREEYFDHMKYEFCQMFEIMLPLCFSYRQMFPRNKLVRCLRSLNQCSNLQLLLLFNLRYCAIAGTSSSYNVLTNVTGSGLCGSGPPSNSTLINQPRPLCDVPASVLCGWQCSRSVQCVGYNYRTNNNTCEMFLYDTQFLVVPGCTYFQVND